MNKIEFSCFDLIILKPHFYYIEKLFVSLLLAFLWLFEWLIARLPFEVYDLLKAALCFHLVGAIGNSKGDLHWFYRTWWSLFLITIPWLVLEPELRSTWSLSTPPLDYHYGMWSYGFPRVCSSLSLPPCQHIIAWGRRCGLLPPDDIHIVFF